MLYVEAWVTRGTYNAAPPPTSWVPLVTLNSIIISLLFIFCCTNCLLCYIRPSILHTAFHATSAGPT